MGRGRKHFGQIIDDCPTFFFRQSQKIKRIKYTPRENKAIERNLLFTVTKSADFLPLAEAHDTDQPI